MCLAIPGLLKLVDDDAEGAKMGKVDFGGVLKEVCLEYTPEAKAGDYVLVHVGFALNVVDPDEAARTFELLKELEQLGELESADEAHQPENNST